MQKSAQPLIFSPFTDGFHDTANQVHDWVMRRAQAYIREDTARKESISSVEQFESYKNTRQLRFQHSIGSLLLSDDSLNAVTTGEIHRDDYTIRKIIYQSLPGLYVTGNLYIPDSIDKPAPAVLMLCGHSCEGKAAPLYQKVCIDLARSGFMVLIIDAPSNGELLQYCDRNTGEPLAGWNTEEHSFMQLFGWINNTNICRYFILNAMRGIDLLCSMPQVDPSRIGVTGNSGGGHQTQLLMMCEPRVAAAVTGCSLSTREAYLATGVRAYDGEQNLWSAIRLGLDYDDFLACYAPRPVLVAAAAYDFFAIEGAIESVERARRMYALFDAEENLGLVVGNHRHGYNAPLREACVNWFRKHLQQLPPDFVTGDPEVETPETLRCTKSGRVLVDYPDAVSIVDLLCMEWDDRKAVRNGKIESSFIAQKLAIANRDNPIYPRETALEERDGMVAEKVFFFSEPGIILTAVVYRPLSAPRRAVLMLIPGGTECQETEWPLIRAIVERGGLVMVLDVRGTGAVQMRERSTVGKYESKGTEFRTASDLFMLGTSMVSARTYDVLRGYDYLRSREDLEEVAFIGLYARGMEAAHGMFAAAIEPGLGPNMFVDTIISYDKLMSRKSYSRSVIGEQMIAPELQGELDPEDILDYLSCRPLRVVCPRRADGSLDDTSERIDAVFEPPGAESNAEFLVE